MTDLTILHAPSTLYLPMAKETGLRFNFNRRSTHPLVSTPMVTVQMVDTAPPPASPARPQDASLLSPPRRTFSSKESPRVGPPRPSSAPPERSRFPLGRSTPITAVNPFPRSRTPDFASSRSGTVPVVVRPPTTLFRPKPFWRNTRRSAVNGTFYASSLHLVRRSTFVAAGLPFDKPVADLSALGVESRIGVVVLPPNSFS
ncbi:hypothetical protein BC834DRAFT_924890 [Gloeopeniophorella convolvens]|nr:hypothetical protein BC834DRAFT_924890 [Gloeopeniophorella convolvens]